MSDSAAAKKRIATYGKAGRKRLLEHASRNSIFDSTSAHDERPFITSLDGGVNLGTPQSPRSDASPLKRALPAADVFDFPSDDDIRDNTPEKKRKLQRPAARPQIQRKSVVPAQPPGMVQGETQSNTVKPKIIKKAIAPREQGKSPVKNPIKPSETATKPPTASSKPSPAHRPANATTPKITKPGLLDRPRKPQTPTLASLKLPVPGNDNTGVGPSEVPSNSQEAQRPAVVTGEIYRRPRPADLSNEVPLRTEPLKSPKKSTTPIVSKHTDKTAAPSNVTIDKKPSSDGRSAPGFLTSARLQIWDRLEGDDEEGSPRAITAPKPLDPITTPLRPEQPHQNPRRRIIDSLVTQSNGFTQSPYFSDSDEDAVDTSETLLQGVANNTPSSVDRRSKDTRVASKAMAKAADSNSQASQSAAPRLTYSRQRSMLADAVMSEKMSFEMPLHDSQLATSGQRRGSIPILAPLPSFHVEDLEENGQSSQVIKTVHELRQDGINTRFIEEVGDTLEMINGSNTDVSRRRSGLLELATSLNDKDFFNRFMSHSMDQRLFVHLGKDSDLLSSFLLACILIKRAENGIGAAVVAQLRRQGLVRMLLRLLDVDTNIARVVRDRQFNMSKSAQALLAEYAAGMLSSKTWTEFQVSYLTPQAVALRCLETIVRQMREAGSPTDIISRELNSKLFSIIKVSDSTGDEALRIRVTSASFRLALSTLESHSLRAMSSSEGSLWMKDHLPIIRDVLATTLNHPSKECGPQQLLALRLTLNVTNNNTGASNVFADEKLLQTIGNEIVDRFKLLSAGTADVEQADVVDLVVLLLGVMINFAEWSDKAKHVFNSLQHSQKDPLPGMISIFTENLEKTAEAESMEDTHRNVAFGYLSVMLGFLCLMPDISKRSRSFMAGQAMSPLIKSIEEFISHHKKVDDLFEDDEDGHNPHAGLTERLQAMVDRLITM